MIRRRIQSLLARAFHFLQPKPDPELTALLKYQQTLLNEAAYRDSLMRNDYVERSAELLEARQMAGSGPWLVAESRQEINQPGPFKFREAIDSAGYAGDIDLMLSNVEWRRELNLSWLEFSRWGIQQIILISRLYYIKHPWIRRGVDTSADYVFGRGVEISATDDTAQKAIDKFLERNQQTLGHVALADLERRTWYDGNLFFVFFEDRVDKGEMNVRTIDALEIMDIVTDPEDSDKRWFYRRVWTERTFDEKNGFIGTTTREAWYPDHAYEPTDRVETINKQPVMWNSPIMHEAYGTVSKWLFGCPPIYPIIDWAKYGTKFLSFTITVKQALAQIAATITTKGGQQAVEGIKQQMGTTVAAGAGTGPWDQNPPAIAGSIFASGPDTVIKAFNSQNAGGDPAEVREYRNMAACGFGFPPTFLGDMETSNLATAKTLDRPTELNYLGRQERWHQIFTKLCIRALQISKGAPSGMLQEAYRNREVVIREARRVKSPDGRRFVEVKEDPKAGEIIVSVVFPAILEGDLPGEISATCEAMAAGIDPKVGVEKLYELMDVEDGMELAKEQFPGTVAERQKEKEDIAKAAATAPKPVKPSEALARRAARELISVIEGDRNGDIHAQHVHPR